MSPLDRIANVSTLKVNLIRCYFSDSCRENCMSFSFHIFRLFVVVFLQQHEVDKLYKVEYKPIVSTSDQ